MILTDTLGSTGFVRIAEVIGGANATGAVSLRSALGSHSTRMRIAGIRWFRLSRHFRTDGQRITTDEGITRLAADARADRIVILDFANGVDSARSRTRILTLLINASPVALTVAAGHAFGSARVSVVAGQTGTNGLVIDGPALGVTSARRWDARLRRGWFHNDWFSSCTNKYNFNNFQK